MAATLPENPLGNSKARRYAHRSTPTRHHLMRATTIMVERDRVMAAWRESEFTEDATFSKAPGDRGTVVTVAIPHAAQTTALGSLIGVYAGFVDKFPLGQLFSKGLTTRSGQCNVQKYLQPLMDRVSSGDLHPEEIITNRVKLEDAPEMYKMFNARTDGCVKVVMSP